MNVGGPSPHHHRDKHNSKASCRGSGWVLEESVSSSCFHNYSTAISLAGNTAHPQCWATGTAAFWDLQSLEATGAPGTCSQLQCMLGLVVPVSIPLDQTSPRNSPFLPQLFPTRKYLGHTWACASTFSFSAFLFSGSHSISLLSHTHTHIHTPTHTDILSLSCSQVWKGTSGISLTIFCSPYYPPPPSPQPCPGAGVSP